VEKEDNRSRRSTFVCREGDLTTATKKCHSGDVLLRGRKVDGPKGIVVGVGVEKGRIGES